MKLQFRLPERKTVRGVLRHCLQLILLGESLDSAWEEAGAGLSSRYTL